MANKPLAAPKLCVNCTNYCLPKTLGARQPNVETESVCNRPAGVSLVTGLPLTATAYCRDERNGAFGCCGADAQFFAPK